MHKVPWQECAGPINDLVGLVQVYEFIPSRGIDAEIRLYYDPTIHIMYRVVRQNGKSVWYMTVKLP